MPGNTVCIVTVNNSKELEWYVGDSKMGGLIKWLEKKGLKRNTTEKEVITALTNEKPSVNELLTHKDPVIRILTSYILTRIEEEK